MFSLTYVIEILVSNVSKVENSFKGGYWFVLEHNSILNLLSDTLLRDQPLFRIYNFPKFLRMLIVCQSLANVAEILFKSWLDYAGNRQSKIQINLPESNILRFCPKGLISQPLTTYFMAPNTYKVTQYVQQRMTSAEVNLGKLQRGFPYPSHLVHFRISLRRIKFNWKNNILPNFSSKSTRCLKSNTQ